MAKSFGVSGFLKSPKKLPNKKIYKGRFVCPDVQWTGTGEELLGTFTITAEQLADAAASNILWTDQEVQRGIQPASFPQPKRELSLSEGYPDTKQYIFDTDKADDIVAKLLNGEKLFLSPLIWNLRPSEFEAYWDDAETDLFLYSGKIFLPDSHHRQQAIIKAVELWRSSEGDYPRFTGSREFKIELYFLSRESEGDYFFDKNQRPKPTARSKAYDLTTQDDLSLLAKRVIEFSDNLRGNVNRVTDRLVAKNPQVATLSTVREMMSTYAGGVNVDPSELDGMARVAAQFYDLLAEVRPELGHLDPAERRKTRESLLVDSGVILHGYAALMKDYKSDIVSMGTSRALKQWREKLTYLSMGNTYKLMRWQGDLFDKRNPLWLTVGVLKYAQRSNKLTIINTGASRIAAGRLLRQLLSLDRRPTDLSFLVKG